MSTTPARALRRRSAVDLIVDRRLRVGLALAALLLVALVSNGRLLVGTLRAHARPRPPDAVELYEVRFKPLRVVLPPHGVVGYISDRPHAVKEFYLTQHALAPLVVEHTAERPLVVGNFFDPAAGAAIVRQRRDLGLVRDFGDGLMLLHRDR